MQEQAHLNIVPLEALKMPIIIPRPSPQGKVDALSLQTVMAGLAHLPVTSEDTADENLIIQLRPAGAAEEMLRVAKGTARHLVHRACEPEVPVQQAVMLRREFHGEFARHHGVALLRNTRWNRWHVGNE